MLLLKIISRCFLNKDNRDNCLFNFGVASLQFTNTEYYTVEYCTRGGYKHHFLTKAFESGAQSLWLGKRPGQNGPSNFAQVWSCVQEPPSWRIRIKYIPAFFVLQFSSQIVLDIFFIKGDIIPVLFFFRKYGP